MNRIDPSSTAHRVALAAWIAMILLCVLWEMWIAPIRPGGSWLVLKALPLLLPLRGLLRAENKSYQWALLLILLYLFEGSARAFEPAPFGTLAWIELFLVATFFGAAVTCLRPLKQAARAARHDGKRH